MTKSYYEIDVTSLQNGYQLSAYYRVYNKDAYDNYTSRTDRYVFVTWAEVMTFMSANPLVIPPTYPSEPVPAAIEAVKA